MSTVVPLDRPTTLRLDPTSPSLGGQVFFLDDVGRDGAPLPAPVDHRPSPSPALPPIAIVPSAPIVLALQILTQEVIALRTDLATRAVQDAERAAEDAAARTWTARLRRLWTTARRIVDGLMSRVRS